MGGSGGEKGRNPRLGEGKGLIKTHYMHVRNSHTIKKNDMFTGKWRDRTRGNDTKQMKPFPDRQRLNVSSHLWSPGFM